MIKVPGVLVLILLAAYAVLGMFMDAIGMLLLTLPVVYPAVMALNGGRSVGAADSAFGMNGTLCAVWFGILVVKMAELCPDHTTHGVELFRGCRCQADISVQDVFKGTSPFFIADAITIAVLLAVPSIVLYLPRLLLGP